ncbi:hypothetical protein ACVWZM_004684 [Bradyrhizobium sp. USDA 4501]
MWSNFHDLAHELTVVLRDKVLQILTALGPMSLPRISEPSTRAKAYDSASPARRPKP